MYSRDNQSVGCCFCRNRGYETWINHRLRNDNGDIICKKAFWSNIEHRLPKMYSCNSNTFVYYQYQLLKKI